MEIIFIEELVCELSAEYNTMQERWNSRPDKFRPILSAQYNSGMIYELVPGNVRKQQQLCVVNAGGCLTNIDMDLIKDFT